MKRFLKLVIITLMVSIIALSAVNFLSVDSDALQNNAIGSADDDGECTGEPLNC